VFSAFSDNIPNVIPDNIPSGIPGGDDNGAVILLSNAAITAGSSVGTKVGTFSVSGGSTRPYTFSLTNDAGGKYTVGGSTLEVAAALSVGFDLITARASDTGTSVVTGSFTITVTSSAVAAYVPTYPYVGF
jgi:hypothetical protein